MQNKLNQFLVYLCFVLFVRESQLDEIRPIRNAICQVLEVPVPRILNSKSASSSITPTGQMCSMVYMSGESGNLG